MTHNQTIAQLQELRLQGMAQALQRQLEQPASAELGFEQRLALLVQHEIDSRHDRRSARLLKQASLKYAQAHIEDFDARASRGLERARWMALALSDWASSGATIILNGATGCGKSCPSITGMPAWIDEPAVADAMLDRLLPQAQRIVFKGESLRAARARKTTPSANQS